MAKGSHGVVRFNPEKLPVLLSDMALLAKSTPATAIAAWLASQA